MGILSLGAYSAAATRRSPANGAPRAEPRRGSAEILGMKSSSPLPWLDELKWAGEPERSTLGLEDRGSASGGRGRVQCLVAYEARWTEYFVASRCQIGSCGRATAACGVAQWSAFVARGSPDRARRRAK